jgi:hypothetical protein
MTVREIPLDQPLRTAIIPMSLENLRDCRQKLRCQDLLSKIDAA